MSGFYWSATGWIGTAVYLWSYGYLSFTDTPRLRLYYGANLLAAALVTLSCVHFATEQAVVINLFWGYASYRTLAGRSLQVGLIGADVLTRLLAALTAGAGLAWLIGGLANGASVLAWSATAAFCLAFLLFAARRITRQAFLGYNVYAGAAVLPRLVLDENWPVLALEGAWALISIAGLLNARWRADPVEPEWVIMRPRKGDP